VIRVDYAKFELQRGRLVEALKLLHQIVAAKPDDTASWQLGGQIALSRPEFLQFARDWTQEAVKQNPDDSTILLQRAEALLLNGDAQAALPFWARAHSPDSARHLAALTTCEVVSGVTGRKFTAQAEMAVSQEFLKWYRQLISLKATGLVKQMNGQLEEFRSVVPSAVHVLTAALKNAEAALVA
jgi:predicted Zn-dependent protease